MMPKFRKKPVVIEAVQWSGDVLPIFNAFPEGPFTLAFFNGRPVLHIHTLEGTMSASVDDWIICGVKGEFYPCKPDIFHATYEPAEAATP
jgi:hypothetical protein